MKMKNKGLEQSYDSKLKGFLTLSFKLCFCFFGFSFLAVCLSASLVGAEISSEQLDPVNLLVSHLAPGSQDVNTPNIPRTPSASFRVWEPPNQVAKLQRKQQEQSQTSSIAAVNLAARIDKKLPQSSLLISESPNTHLGRQLWQARISVPKGEKDNKNKSELQRIIEQIRSVEFEPEDKAPEPLIAFEPTQKTEPNETLSDTEVPEKSEEKKIEPKLEAPLPYEPVTDETLQMLENLLQHPEQLKTPFELGEVLFRSGHLKEAGMCYQQALNRKNLDEINSPQNRAWILFQIGNCLRNDDPPTAMEMYRQLIIEYPNSLWTDLAKARSKLVNWYQQDTPRTLIDEKQ